jgi:hypothetical protein
MVESTNESEFDLAKEIERIQSEEVATKVTKFLDPSVSM